MKNLTVRQREVLAFLENFIRKNHFPPTIREVSSFFEITPKAAHDHIRALKTKGIIKTEEGRSRAIDLVQTYDYEPASREIPIVGTVAAGKPIFAEENYDGYIAVPNNLAGKHPCFALKVRGDSMRDAGIMDGDIAIIEQRSTAADGDIIVALLEDSVTLKRFFREKGRIRLAPENSEYKPIYSSDVKILGKLKGLMRQY